MHRKNGQYKDTEVYTMVQNKKTSSKIQKFLSGKGFYIALAFCLLAVGASAYTAIRMDSGPETEVPYIAEDQNDPNVQWGDQQANVPATDVPDTRESAAETEAAPQTEAAVQAEKISFVLPLGNDISKDYSDGEMVYSETMDDWRIHAGIDFSGAADSEVKAISDGTVTAVQTDELYGVTVEIDHGDGVIARYCGLAQDPGVTEGSKVNTGDIIGKVGSVPCESAEESHLHFEVRVDGTLTDPLEILGKAG